MDKESNYIRFNAIIEVLGKPKEYVENAIKDYVNKIREDDNFIIVKEDFAEAKEKETMWATFVELEIVTKGLQNLTGFCIDYMPSSIEIVKPTELIIKNSDFSNFLNDLQARLHNLDMIVKTLKGENDMLKRNMHKSLTNSILISLVQYNLTKSQIAKSIGLKEDDVSAFIEDLEKEKKIKKQGEGYILVK